jgi:hypothetical protein
MLMAEHAYPHAHPYNSIKIAIILFTATTSAALSVPPSTTAQLMLRLLSALLRVIQAK